MYFNLNFTEQNGEQQYTYDYLLKAPTLVAATAKARLFLRGWYDDFTGIVDGRFEFGHGEREVHKISVVETTKQAFMESMLFRYSV